MHTEPYDLVIRGGLVHDGRGNPPVPADVAIEGGRIAVVGIVRARGRREIDATGLLVTPGFIDPHTHLDMQLTFSERATPCSWHGVTTVVMGNCGVGFAPCKPADRDTLIVLMEGVEDIPGSIMRRALPWTWQSFPEFMDALDARHYDVDVVAQIPHAALRVAVMGERGVAREPATQDELASMRQLVREAVAAGALGVSTSRSRGHVASDGRPIPSFGAPEAELDAIAGGLADAGRGILQLIPNFEDVDAEMALLQRVAARCGRPMLLSLLQFITRPDEWRKVLGLIQESNAAGGNIIAQVIPRATGILLGHSASQNPFFRRPSYLEIAALPLAERMKILRDPAFRARILAEEMPVNPDDAEDIGLRVAKWDRLFPLTVPLDYEPGPEQSMAGIAARTGRTPDEEAYDYLLGDEGRALLYRPFSNYGYGNLDDVRDMISAPNTLIGLGDAGAHLGGITDVSSITFLLTHWTRDRKRGGLFPVEWAIRRLTSDAARILGLQDRGVIAPGYRADLNLIDYDRLALRAPEVLHDLPGGASRLVQRADGYVATIVAGTVVQENGVETGDLPGRLVRGAQAAPQPATSGLP